MSRSILLAQVGDLYAGRARQLTWARALALSGGSLGTPGWPEKNLHTDLEAAKAAGLSAVVVSGTQWEGYLVGFLVELFGIDWFFKGRLDIKIPRSVKIDETVQPKARVEGREHDGDHVRIALSVWCENQDGEQVLVGTASCDLPAPGER
jgi:acyl dehydratase